MSTTISKPTVQQRAVAATAQLKRSLGLDDLKLLSAAVAEAAAQEVVKNPEFSTRVRSIYAELASSPVRQSRSRASQQPLSQLVPLPGNEGMRFDPFAPLDPSLLLRLYGPQQLRTALNAYSLKALREATSAVQARYPDTKPTDRRTKDALVTYLVERLASQ